MTRPRLYSRRIVATEILDVSPRTLARMIRCGEFPAPDVLVGRRERWTHEVVRAWVKERRLKQLDNQ